MSWRGGMATAGMIPFAMRPMVVIRMEGPAVWIGCAARRAARVPVEIRIDGHRVVAVVPVRVVAVLPPVVVARMVMVAQTPQIQGHPTGDVRPVVLTCASAGRRLVTVVPSICRPKRYISNCCVIAIKKLEMADEPS